MNIFHRGSRREEEIGGWLKLHANLVLIPIDLGRKTLIKLARVSVGRDDPARRDIKNCRRLKQSNHRVRGIASVYEIAGKNCAAARGQVEGGEKRDRGIILISNHGTHRGPRKHFSGALIRGSGFFSGGERARKRKVIEWSAAGKRVKGWRRILARPTR